MSFLKDVINSKKRKLLEDDSSVYRQKKYVKRGEADEEREHQYIQQQQAKESERQQKMEAKLGIVRPDPSAATPALTASGSAIGEKKDDLSVLKDKVIIPKEEVMQKLRQRGEPITLFGEADVDRAERLRKLEIALPVDYEAQGFGSDWIKILRDEEEREEATFEDAVRKSEEEDPDWKEEDREPEGDEERILFMFRRLYREWVEALDARPDTEKKSSQGRMETVTAKQSKQYMKPLLRLCRTKKVPPEILREINKICTSIQERNYVKANDAYYRLAIGNAPWPMGVTMVGIHERSARSKIASSEVAHVLNDETQRKYIQAIKRLMTFAQKKYPTLPSMSVN